MKIEKIIKNGEVLDFEKIFKRSTYKEKKYYVNTLYNYFANGKSELNENHKQILFLILKNDKEKTIATHDNGFISSKFQKIISEVYLKIEISSKLKHF